MQLGGLLEDLTVAKARAGIEAGPPHPRTARDDGRGRKVIPAEDVQVGDQLQVLRGDHPGGGVILPGQTSINQAVMTGESPSPWTRGRGRRWPAAFRKPVWGLYHGGHQGGEDSSIQRMIRLVQSADAGKAKIVNLADRWATWIVVIALVSAGITWAVTGRSSGR